MRWVYLRRPTLRWGLTALAVAVLLAALLFALAVRRDRPGDSGEPQDLAAQTDDTRCRYDLELVFDPENSSLDGVLELTYVNGESCAMDTLYFYVWPNSFASIDYGVFAGEEELAYPNGFEPGGLEVTGVSSGGEAIKWRLEGEQNQVLAVSLDEPVPPGGQTLLVIAYTVTVPECYGRFGHGEHTWSLVNAHPILAVCDDETGRWYNEYLYYSVGDPFYSDAADYTARIETPPGYRVASTGAQSTREDADAWVTTVEGPGQRDFGFVVSDDFKVTETEQGGVTVRSWYFGSDLLGRQAATAAAEALAIYSERYGDYLWDELDVVMCDFYIGGMEYPGMVLIDQSTYTLSMAMVMEMIVAHEVGHQWWYAAVGSNQITQPWVDEALTEFCTALYFEDRYPLLGEQYRDRYVYDSYDYMEDFVTVAENVGIMSPVTAFSDNTAYSLVVYGRGAHMFDDLRAELGETVFYQALSDYYERFTYGLAEGSDLVDAFSRAAGRDMTDWFDEYAA